MYRQYIKRLLDIVCAILALVCFSWLYVLLAVLVRIKLGSPVIFSQERPGKDGEIFKLYKYRTMTNERDGDGNLLLDKHRLTKFGLFLRRYSLDELPEAWNILTGSMSVVGPRPLLVEYLPRYNERQRRRHEVKPGLTGLAQVNGRNAISWEEKFAYDVAYIDNMSFWLDVKIVAATVKKAFVKPQGISRESGAAMPLFMGTEEKEVHHV